LKSFETISEKKKYAPTVKIKTKRAIPIKQHPNPNAKQSTVVTLSVIPICNFHTGLKGIHTTATSVTKFTVMSHFRTEI